MNARNPLEVYKNPLMSEFLSEMTSATSTDLLQNRHNTLSLEAIGILFEVLIKSSIFNICESLTDKEVCSPVVLFNIISKLPEEFIRLTKIMQTGGSNAY